ncbi:nucleotide-diphospho-sugar transferase [Radiomyces spectabilis]|uniref:nucleotide-diphospho-sugar transferase n=1 Tax=Radiomyces spectabilis TaxID=64574 RepID=UPI00221FDA18|nr:nucleotide-diphospho-sugar transferase [Radiomyces spectabilis]KAI8376137.1 nucleotide-diphospho-sugar transferase [Radiomyces spectabilis]
MMSKRRQTLGIQILLGAIILIVLGYTLFPDTSDEAWQKHTARFRQQLLNKKLSSIRPGGKSGQVKAAFVVLARNDELVGIKSAIQQMEDRFNHRFNYPYVFLNDDEFTDEFKQMTSSLTNAETHYGTIDRSMWGYPSHINTTLAAECRAKMQDANIIYGDSESYRHMCRFQSGFFYRHPLLKDFEYYWRVEPYVKYFCDIDYDVFQMMKDNGYKYGWTISLTEYMDTVPTLWSTTLNFINEHKHLINWGKNSLLDWITDDNWETYNGCHFWSNFEIGSLEFLRSPAYTKYFEYLDKAGGFFYERWGDAPVHSLGVALFLKPEEVHFFNDIGYKHEPLMHCPTENYLQSRCSCDPAHNFDWDPWNCAARYRDRIDREFVWDEKKYREKTNPYRIDAA